MFNLKHHTATYIASNTENLAQCATQTSKPAHESSETTSLKVKVLGYVVFQNVHDSCLGKTVSRLTEDL